MTSTAAAALAKKRVRRQKQFLAVGTVCLLGIVGYQLPKMLGGHHQTAAPALPTTMTSTVAASPPAVADVPVAGALRDTDGIAVERDTSQLLSFGLFKSKDPFVQQLSDVPAAAPAAAAAPTPAAAPVQKKKTTTSKGGTSAATPNSPVPPGPSVITTPAPVPTSTLASPTPVIPPTGVAVAPSATTTTPAAPPSAPATALISTNGVCEQVPVNGTFPANEDLFRVVEIAKSGKWVKIGIAGGSYDSGQATATAKLGVKLTLVNTADGSRYVIVLQAKCTPAQSVPAPTSTPTLTTPVPAVVPAPAPASVPPIVTDANDTAPAPSS
jgi:hypothetical protein